MVWGTTKIFGVVGSMAIDDQAAKCFLSKWKYFFRWTKKVCSSIVATEGWQRIFLVT
jgi:hypothetical protein